MNIEEEEMNIQSHIDKGNFHAAINLSISAMNACRRENNQSGVDLFLAVIQGIVDTMKKESSNEKYDA